MGSFLCILRVVPTTVARHALLNHDSEKVAVDTEQPRGSGCVLEFASDEMKNNLEAVLAVVGHNGDALRHASWKLKANHDVVLAAVTQSGGALEFASDEIKNDLEVVLAAVTQFGYALQHASMELRGNRQVVLVAVKQLGAVLKYASTELKANPNVVLEAVAQTMAALVFASTELRSGGLRAFVEALLCARHVFVKTILVGSWDPRSNLNLLFGWVNFYHATNFKRLIAAYAGVPVGGHAALVTRAARSLGVV